MYISPMAKKWWALQCLHQPKTSLNLWQSNLMHERIWLSMGMGSWTKDVQGATTLWVKWVQRTVYDGSTMCLCQPEIPKWLQSSRHWGWTLDNNWFRCILSLLIPPTRTWPWLKFWTRISLHNLQPSSFPYSWKIWLHIYLLFWILGNYSSNCQHKFLNHEIQTGWWSNPELPILNLRWLQILCLKCDKP